jgi:hypothetical protein
LLACLLACMSLFEDLVTVSEDEGAMHCRKTCSQNIFPALARAVRTWTWI